MDPLHITFFKLAIPSPEPPDAHGGPRLSINRHPKPPPNSKSRTPESHPRPSRQPPPTLVDIHSAPTPTSRPEDSPEWNSFIAARDFWSIFVTQALVRGPRPQDVPLPMFERRNSHAWNRHSREPMFAVLRWAGGNCLWRRSPLTSSEAAAKIASSVGTSTGFQHQRPLNQSTTH